jgi:two-component system chemotaxis sensor kinase CheA
MKVYNKMSDYLDPNNEELLKDFFIEAQMQVEMLEQNILVLENDPQNKDAVDEIFRAAHTLKGGAGTVQMNEIAGFTHVLEDVLDGIRDGSISMSEDLVDILLGSIDIIKSMMGARIEGRVFDGDSETMKKSLSSYLGTQTPVKNPVPTPEATKQVIKPAGSPSGPVNMKLSEYELLEMKEASAGKNVVQVKVFFNEDNPMNSVGGIQVFAILKEVGTILKTVPDFDELYDDNYFPEVDYYVAINPESGEFGDRLNIQDVTTGFELAQVSFDSKPSGEASSTQGSKIEPVRESKASSSKLDPSPVSAPASFKTESESNEDKDLQTQIDQAHEGKKESKKAVVGSILRVDSKRIDNLLNLVSETVINKATFNQISTQFSDNLLDMQTQSLHMKEGMKELFESLPDYLDKIQSGMSVKEVKKELLNDYSGLLGTFDNIESNLKNTFSTFRNTSQNLGRIIGELHEGVLRIRMVPISQIFGRFPRLVRDLSKTLKKKVNLVIEGEDTELDKSVIEDLLDPLIHCVRNTLDHGIELPKDRLSKGKREEGTLLLKASNEGNMIVIEVHDDGKGIDVDAVKKKAIERGLIHPNKKITDVEAFNLIFEPGFSTAKKITNISGRGVGLDVVRKQIEKLNGSVSIWSEKGKGTKFTIKLPLTLAIIQGLLVKVGTEIYAIPITSVIDSHRIRPSEIKVIDNYEVFNVRKDVISILRLNRLFGLQSLEESEYTFIVVVGSGDKKMGLMVDSLIGEEDVVIKPLKDSYTNSPGIAGATILGNGPSLIDYRRWAAFGPRPEE